MTRFGIRNLIIRLLGGTPGTEQFDPEPEDEDEDCDCPVCRGEAEAGGPSAVQMINVPPGVNPIEFIQEHLQSMGRPPGVGPMRTLRAGPASKNFAMRVIDCVGMMDPTEDPEVQHLLSSGWEPFGVHNFSSFTGAQGVRVYFKRSQPKPLWPGGPMQAVDE